MNKVKILIASAIVLIAGCKVNKNSDTKKTEASLLAKPINIIGHKSTANYQASRLKQVDLIHTHLQIKFNYELQYAFGQINLLFKPYFYATNKVVIDAKGMALHRIAKIKGKDTTNLNFTYDSLQITVQLDKYYSRNETFNIFIDYTSKPNELNFEGSAAIKEAKGLYFINPKKEDAEKPRQIWTQGETESNSCWMPTIDAPNEKHTQEIFITAQANEVTLSNGKLISVSKNADGTHTDYWKQPLPHAPYLTMMAIGEFNITKHKWHDSIEVSYYLEKDFAKHADLIFGPTTEMLTCFSERLGVDYPWEKFSQIIVRDYVSGAMENTTAVIHGEFVQHDEREHYDNDQEDIIAHEMFHHWFGDLTTAESWSNLPLNESFATYGEYIWNEWKHGAIEADAAFDGNLQGYLRGKQNATKTPIRFYYHNKEDMFDGVSYAKGGRILHMLRKEVGDEAFFKSLQLYLTQNKFKSAEIHHLRLAFEEITGRDLNWFFNQWFLKAGHPELEINTVYNNNTANLTIVQKQDSVLVGVYELPITVAVYDKNGVQHLPIKITKINETFSFKGDSIFLVNFDEEKALVAKINEVNSNETWYAQLTNVASWKAKQQAITGLLFNYAKAKKTMNNDLKNAVLYCLNFNHIRVIQLGIQAIGQLNPAEQKLFENEILALCNYKKTASIRSSALMILYNWNDVKYKSIFEMALADSSNQVLASGLYGLSNLDSLVALKAIGKWKTYFNFSVSQAVSAVISKNSFENENNYFEKAINKTNYGKRNLMYLYTKYLLRSNNEIINDAVSVFQNLSNKMDGEERKYLLFNSVNEIKESLVLKNDLVKKQLLKDAGNVALQLQIKNDEILIKKYEELVKSN
jgi:aminopeptidase N